MNSKVNQNINYVEIVVRSEIADSIAPTTNNDDSHVPTSASGALGDDVITSKNIATEGSIQGLYCSQALRTGGSVVRVMFQQ